MTIFGDIKEIKTISLSDNESVSVPQGEIWKVNPIVTDYLDTNNQGGRIILNGDVIALTWGRDNSSYTVEPKSVFVEEGDTFTAKETNSVNPTFVLNIVVLEAV